MYIVVGCGGTNDSPEVVETLVHHLGKLAFEVRQMLAGGGPVVLAHFAESAPAETLAGNLSRDGMPVQVIDSRAVRDRDLPFVVHRFVPGDQAMSLESADGDRCDMSYGEIDLLLAAMGSTGAITRTVSVSERRFSLGKTLLAGGVPMTRKVAREQTLTSEERDEVLWVVAGARPPVVFPRGGLVYDGLGESKQVSRDLNFAQLKKSLQQLAPHARYDERLLKRAGVVHLLGKGLNPDTDLDLAFEILARCLRREANPAV